MVQTVAIVVSLALTAVTLVVVAWAVRSMLGVIRKGQAAPGRTGNPAGRTVTMLKETFGHTRMLQWTWVGALHWFAFAAFLFLSTAVGAAYFQLFDAEWTLPVVGELFVYEWLAEVLGLFGALGIIPLIVYRLTHLPSQQGRASRFFGSTMWQAFFVEAMVLLESAAILFIRGAEYNLAKAHGGEIADHATGFHFPISQFFGGLYPTGHDSIGTLENIIFVIAAIKIVSAMAWLLVVATNLTMGVAWHRFTAWFNIWFKREDDGSTALGAVKPLTSNGKPITLDDIDDLDEDSVLGAGSIWDFSWKDILDFTTCTECGRCQSQCPAWHTDKPLSPKLMMMAMREQAYVAANGDGAADRALVGAVERNDDGEPVEWFYMPEGGEFVVDEDALWACTNCGACVQQCPVDIEHVDHFVDMRRYQVLVESNFPSELNGLFKGLENKGNPWNMSPTARMDWAKDLPFDVKVVGDDIEDLDSVDWLFWVGCAGAYEDRAKKTTRAVAELLDIAGVSFGVLGNGETCTGDSARRAGNEFVFQGLAQQNVETFKEYKVKKVVSTCAHCFNTLKNEYKEFGIELEVVHHTQLLNRLVREGKLTTVKSGAGAHKRSITYHDPCFLGRHNKVYTPPRELLEILPGAQYKEMERSNERSFCCGAGGARMWMEETIGERININRTTEAVGTGADQIAVGCPFCRVMLADGLTKLQADGVAREEVEVLDVAQMLLASVKGEQATKMAPGEGAPATAEPAGDPLKKSFVDPKAAIEARAAGTAVEVLEKPVAEPKAKKNGKAKKSAKSDGDVGISIFSDSDHDAPAAKASAPSPSPAPAATGETAAAEGGSSLFGDAPAADAPAESTSGGSLFGDAPAADAPAESKSGGSLFDDAPAADTPAESKSGGSLFDTPAPAEEKPAEESKPASGGSLFDVGGDSGGSLFDTPAPAAEEKPAEAKAEPAKAEPTKAEPAKAEPAKAAPAPASEVPSGGSLFDIAASESAPESAAAAPAPAESDARAEEAAAVDESPEAAAPAAPPASPAAAPAAEIPSGGSLFDIAAPDEPTTANEATPESAPASESAAAHSVEPTMEAAEAAAEPAEATAAEEAATEDEPAEPEQAAADESTAEAATPASSDGETNEPRTDVDINKSGSLFDL
ncbi:Fe-S oxidoreductase [Nocardioides thalensis]|uniref:Fe-S oxidoreductase n=1 Tax=Nocardioides thalensis TaxID=1914755 RepID=A0A853C9I7_9ACTN|nr:heterodisulfide reductase-related iron-sulfur binding cluster [Nocardioides thalensis]NYJ03108.1 Fe-S oxidoreductase [Nocardioides thalensis]